MKGKHIETLQIQHPFDEDTNFSTYEIVERRGDKVELKKAGPALHNEVVFARKRFIDEETGEPCDFTLVRRKVRDTDFLKMWAAQFLVLADLVGNTPIQIFAYILSKLKYNSNYILESQQQIAKNCKVSTRSVNRLFVQLLAHKIICKVGKVYEVNPELCWKGNANDRRKLMIDIEPIREPGQADLPF